MKAKLGSERQNQGKGLGRGMLEDRFLLSSSKNLLIIRLFKHRARKIAEGCGVEGKPVEASPGGCLQA